MESVGAIDIERRQNRLLKFCYVPATSAAHNRLLFFAAAVYSTNKQTRQAVHAIKQTILLDVYGWSHAQIISPASFCHPGDLNKDATMARWS